MDMIEQLLMERELLQRKDSVEELERVNKIIQHIQNLKKEPENNISLRKKLVVEPGSEVHDLVQCYIGYLIQQDKSLYWLKLIGTAIYDLEEELHVNIIFSNKYYGARNLLCDMEQKKDVLILENGVVKRNNYENIKQLKKQNK